MEKTELIVVLAWIINKTATENKANDMDSVNGTY